MTVTGPKRVTDMRNWLMACWLTACSLVVSGCGYTTRGFYPENIRTVSVPIFKNESGFRRDIEFQLTQNLIEMIESRTPYKVVSDGDADTEIRGTISQYYKSPFGEDGYDNPRGGNMAMTVQVTWIDNRTGEALSQGGAVQLISYGNFTIDTAESISTADQQLVRDMSQKIVSLMQSPW